MCLTVHYHNTPFQSIRIFQGRIIGLGENSADGMIFSVQPCSNTGRSFDLACCSYSSSLFQVFLEQSCGSRAQFQPSTCTTGCTPACHWWRWQRAYRIKKFQISPAKSSVPSAETLVPHLTLVVLLFDIFYLMNWCFIFWSVIMVCCVLLRKIKALKETILLL